MIGRLAALILLSTLSQTRDVPDQIPLIVAELGDTLNLTCPLTGDISGLFYWYKLKFGYMVQTVAAGTYDKLTLDGQFNNSRFNVTKWDHQYFLNITNVTKEDEGTYFCQSGAAYQMQFIKGILLAVNDYKKQQKSVYVKQSPETELVQQGDTIALQCSLLSNYKGNTGHCPEEQSVYWFRAGSGESYPSVLYTQSHVDKNVNRSCDYSLSKTIQNSSDAGTYYCAVVTCGEILFGEGTKVETRQELCPFAIVLVILLTGCVTVVVTLIISRNKMPICKHFKGEVTVSNHVENDRSAENQPRNVDGEAAAMNYVVLDFPSRQNQRWMNKRDFPQDCMYSGMAD